MAEFIRVASVADVEPGKVKPVKINGKTIALCNVQGTFYALDDVCIHRGGPLSEGYVEGHKLECPWHGWQFDVKTGLTGTGSGMGVPTYQVKIEGDDVLVAL